MILEIILLVAGIILILKGSDWVTDSAVPLAKALNTTNVAIGLILVSVLLSLPELLIALITILRDHAEIGVGAILGSIIVNLGLIVGLSALLTPLRIPRHVITRDAVFMLVTTLVVVLIGFEDMNISGRDGIIFILLFIPYLINVYEQEKTLAVSERRKESDMITKTLIFVGKTGGGQITFKDTKMIFAIGFLMLILGTLLFTESLISLARILTLPELLIGLTIGALGPSIPNLAAALQAVKKGYVELAVSETIGSNIFTLLITLGIMALFSTIQIDMMTAIVTAPAMVVVTVLFFIFTMRGTIKRDDGALLLLIYLMAMALEIWVRLK